MEFKKLTLDCIKTLKPYFVENQCRICDCTIGGTFLWRDFHNTEYAVEDGALYFKVGYPETAFAPPRGSDINKRSYEHIIGYCDDNSLSPQLCSVSEPVLRIILELFPDSEFRTEREWSDYLYLSSDLTALSGRRFSGQRNHISRFIRENPSWSFKPVTAENITDVRKFYEKYAVEHKKDSAAYIEADRKALETLDNLDLYGMSGGALYADGSVIGVSFGETTGDTLFVHIEKADTAYHGSYPMLLNQFAGMYAGEGIEYINREEDDGVEGLRTSKLSYHPSELLNKYMVKLKK